MTSMSRSGQSRTRLDAYGRLTRAGLSTSVLQTQSCGVETHYMTIGGVVFPSKR